MSLDYELICNECEAEFTIQHEEICEIEFCPFCGFKLEFEDYDEKEFDEE
jgi:rRNA maturation endonuclease Nob1